MQNIIDKAMSKGGITLDYYKQEPALYNGYMVSIEGFEKTFTISDLNIEEIENAFTEYTNIIKGKKHLYVGLWIDKGLIYLDISKHIKTRHQAVTMGINNKQLSIYDIKNDAYISLTKNVYIVYRYNQENDDIQYIKEYDNVKSIERDYNISNAWHYITNTIEDIKSVLDNKYIIITDRIPAWEV